MRQTGLRDGQPRWFSLLYNLWVVPYGGREPSRASQWPDLPVAGQHEECTHERWSLSKMGPSTVVSW